MKMPSQRDVEVVLGNYARCAQCKRKPDWFSVEFTAADTIRCRAICHGPRVGKDVNYEIRDVPIDEMAMAFAERGQLPDMTFFRGRVFECHRPTLRELLEGKR